MYVIIEQQLLAKRRDEIRISLRVNENNGHIEREFVHHLVAIDRKKTALIHAICISRQSYARVRLEPDESLFVARNRPGMFRPRTLANSVCFRGQPGTLGPTHQPVWWARSVTAGQMCKEATDIIAGIKTPQPLVRSEPATQPVVSDLSKRYQREPVRPPPPVLVWQATGASRYPNP